MARYLRIKDGVVQNAEVWTAEPSQDGFTFVQSSVGGPGWRYEEGNLIEPEPVGDAPASIDIAEFLARVTSDEYTAVMALTVPNTPQFNFQVALWVEILRGRGVIDVTGSTAQAAKAGLIALGVFTQERADAVFS